MKLAVAAFGVAALVGAGYVIGKKIIEFQKEKCEEEDELFGFNEYDEYSGSEFDGMGDFDNMRDILNEDGIDASVYARGRASRMRGKNGDYGKKIKKASLFAVGAIKTGADKFGETIQDIKSKDMVEKGKSAVEAVKQVGGNVKNDIKKEVEELKDVVNTLKKEDDSNNDTAPKTEVVVEATITSEKPEDTNSTGTSRMDV
ncbi:MAG: hypothetical protein FWF76_07560 [Oscillospiraceae bacterium]|nr:hypothetical protein [Oscillospiraceae bacterium]